MKDINILKDECKKMASYMMIKQVSFHNSDLYKRYYLNGECEIYWDAESDEIRVFTGTYHPHKGDWLNVKTEIISPDDEFYVSATEDLHKKMSEDLYKFCKEEFLKEETEKYVKKILGN